MCYTRGTPEVSLDPFLSTLSPTRLPHRKLQRKRNTLSLSSLPKSPAQALLTAGGRGLLMRKPSNHGGTLRSVFWGLSWLLHAPSGPIWECNQTNKPLGPGFPLQPSPLAQPKSRDPARVAQEVGLQTPHPFSILQAHLDGAPRVCDMALKLCWGHSFEGVHV